MFSISVKLKIIMQFVLYWALCGVWFYYLLAIERAQSFPVIVCATFGFGYLAFRGLTSLFRLLSPAMVEVQR